MPQSQSTLASNHDFAYKLPMPVVKLKVPKPTFDLPGYLAAATTAVNGALDGFLPPPTARPATIHKAMRYSLFAGGKRMRPALCLAAASACGGGGAPALPPARAPPCLHPPF